MPNRKVQFRSIEVFRDGDPVGKGEIYWTFNVGDNKVSERPARDGVKAGNGESIRLNDSMVVHDLDGRDELEITGSVGDNDPGSANESDFFRHTYTRGDNWGVGSHTARLRDGRKFDVAVHYTVSNA